MRKAVQPSPPSADVAGSEVPHRELIDQAARFSHDFMRWIDGAGMLTYPRLRVLELLHCKGPARMGDLAAQTGLTSRNLTTLADALENEGLVRRASHPDDRRATLLELTDSGSRAAERSLSPRLVEISSLFEHLSREQRVQFTRVLAILTEAMAANPCAKQLGSAR